jgi:uncharacterized coiled-coil protein SlyX
MEPQRHLEKRVTELEIALTHVTRLHDQLNEVVTDQTRRIDRQSRTIDRLIEQIRQLKAKRLPADDPFDETPPHY